MPLIPELRGRIKQIPMPLRAAWSYILSSRPPGYKVRGHLKKTKTKNRQGYTIYQLSAVFRCNWTFKSIMAIVHLSWHLLI